MKLPPKRMHVRSPKKGFVCSGGRMKTEKKKKTMCRLWPVLLMAQPHKSCAQCERERSAQHRRGKHDNNNNGEAIATSQGRPDASRRAGGGGRGRAEVVSNRGICFDSFPSHLWSMAWTERSLYVYVSSLARSSAVTRRASARTTTTATTTAATTKRRRRDRPSCSSSKRP